MVCPGEKILPKMLLIVSARRSININIKDKESRIMKNRHGMIRMIALLVCLVMIGTLLPVMASADLPTPTLTGAVAEGTGIRVSWNAVSGADGYRVFRKTPGASWVKVADVTGTSYKDTNAQENTTYTYTVRAMAGGNVVSGYNSVGVSAAWTKSSAGYLATPKMVSATVETTGIREGLLFLDEVNCVSEKQEALHAAIFAI